MIRLPPRSRSKSPGREVDPVAPALLLSISPGHGVSLTSVSHTADLRHLQQCWVTLRGKRNLDSMKHVNFHSRHQIPHDTKLTREWAKQIAINGSFSERRNLTCLLSIVYCVIKTLHRGPNTEQTPKCLSESQLCGLLENTTLNSLLTFLT